MFLKKKRRRSRKARKWRKPPDCMSDMKEDRVARSPALMLSWNFVFCVVGIPASGLRDHVIGEWPQMGYLSCVTANVSPQTLRCTSPPKIWSADVGGSPLRHPPIRIPANARGLEAGNADQLRRRRANRPKAAQLASSVKVPGSGMRVSVMRSIEIESPPPSSLKISRNATVLIVVAVSMV
jgi:hypothetical protein